MNKKLIFMITVSSVMISYNQYISAQYQYVCGNFFKSLAQHIFDETTQSLVPNNVQNHDIIFVKTDMLGEFFERCHPYIKHKYILISHNSDHSAPAKYAHHLDSPIIIAWLAQNVDGYIHKKLISIPIGIANPCWDHGNPKVIDCVIAQFRSLNNPDAKKNTVYLNFARSTNASARNKAFDHFEHLPFCHVADFCRDEKKRPFAHYLTDLNKYRFIVSPAGNGIDCHRTWEAMLLNCIPIVLSSLLDPLLEECPVIIVQSWQQATPAFLQQEYEKIKEKKYDNKKAYCKYWSSLIRDLQNQKPN